MLQSLLSGISSLLEISMAFEMGDLAWQERRQDSLMGLNPVGGLLLGMGGGDSRNSPAIPVAGEGIQLPGADVSVSRDLVGVAMRQTPRQQRLNDNRS